MGGRFSGSVVFVRPKNPEFYLNHFCCSETNVVSLMNTYDDMQFYALSAFFFLIFFALLVSK